MRIALICSVSAKKDLANRCTNAIKLRENGETDKFCSTHLIMNGMKEAKRKVPLSSATAASALATNNPSTSAMPSNCLPVMVRVQRIAENL